MEKKKHFSGSGNYYRKEAAYIMYQIKEQKIKPTDGLKELLDYSYSIQKNLPPNAVTHFRYLTETLSNIKNIAPSAFKGATANPGQMKHIASIVIKEAVYSNQDDDCIFTMLEVLANSVYGLTDSSIRSDLKMNEFDPLKDTSVGDSIIGKVVGTTFKVGLRAIFEGANVAKNTAKRLNCKFSNDEQNQIAQETKTSYKTKDQIVKYLQFYNLCI